MKRAARLNLLVLLLLLVAIAGYSSYRMNPRLQEEASASWPNFQQEPYWLTFRDSQRRTFDFAAKPAGEGWIYRVGVDAKDWRESTWNADQAQLAKLEIESAGKGVWGLVSESLAGEVRCSFQVGWGFQDLQISDQDAFYASKADKPAYKRLFEAFPKTMVGKLLLTRGMVMPSPLWVRLPRSR